MDPVVRIDTLAFGGKGIGRINGKVVFVPYTAPEDEVRVRITEDKKGFSEGVLLDIVTPSPMRKEPECPLYGVCGGCTLQHISYETQVDLKQMVFEDTLKKIGKFDIGTLEAPVASPKPLNYRSRARFHVFEGTWGFFEAKSHKVAAFDTCPILDPLLNDYYRELKDFFSKEKDPGIFAVDVGVSERDKRVVAAFHVKSDTSYSWKRLTRKAGTLLKGFEVWKSAPFRRDRGRRVFTDGDRDVYYEAGGVNFSAGISVFSQVNREQNRLLIDRVLLYAGLTGKERVLDLFSGVGNITLPVAGWAGESLGVESSAEAVKAAGINASLNSIKNAHFEGEEALGWLRRHTKGLEKRVFDVVVLDPPRGGELGVVKALSGIRPKKIIYVSCSPPTLARDAGLLTGNGYRVNATGLFDMFPQTFHIESVTVLESI